MKKLLISGLGGSLFPFLHDQLKNKYELYYVDSNIHLKNIYPDYNFFHVPLVSDPDYFIEIDRIINTHKINIYLPLIDEEIVPLIEKFADKLIIISPSLEFARLCINKYELMQQLKNSRISTIESYTADNYSFELNYPVFLKPISGRGSRGIFKISNKDQYEAYFKLYPEYSKKDILVQENIDGQEYTIGVLTNNMNELMVINSKKVVQKKGITQMAVTENNELINIVIKKLVSEFKPSGPFNVQLYITPEKQIKIFEINPRFSTTTVMSYAAKIDEISLFLDFYNKNFAAEIIVPKDGLNLYRRWESIFYHS